MSAVRLVVVAALAAVLAAVLVPAAASAQGAGPSHGVVMDGLPEPDDQTLRELEDLQAKNAKIFINYAALDVSHPAGVDGRIGQFATTVRLLHGKGINTTVIYFGSAQGNNVPPANVQEWADRLGRLAKGLAGFGVTYTIWNEADGVPFWAPGPNIDQYMPLLRAGSAAVRANDPTGIVGFTPLTGGNWRYLQAAYDRGAKGLFDVMPVDLGTACNIVSPTFYIRDPQDPNLISQTSFLAYREVRKTLLANGDAHVPILNEFGWSTAQGATSCNQGVEAGKKPGGVTREQQAQFLREAHHCMREDDYVQKAYWFEFRDRISDPAVGFNAFNPDDNFGLITRTAGEKPAYNAFKDVARGIDTVVGPCGDFVPPAITVVRPQPGEKYADKLDIQVRATDPSNVTRISLAFNGANEIRNFTGGDVGNDRTVGLTPWFGAQNLPLGQHTISFIALDGFGNQSRVDVPVEKVTPAQLGSTRNARFTLGTKVSCRKGNRRARSAKLRLPLCQLKGRVLKEIGGPSVAGRIRTQWQWYSPPKPKKKGVRKKAIKGQWKTLHKGSASIAKPFTLSQRIARKGKWRLRVTFDAKAPYKRVVAKDRAFTVR